MGVGVKVRVLCEYPGPDGAWRKPGELVDEHPSTALSLHRRGLVGFETKPARSYETKPVSPLETFAGAGNPSPGLSSAGTLLNTPTTGVQLPDVAPSKEGERQGQDAAGSTPAPAIKPTKTKRKKRSKK